MLFDIVWRFVDFFDILIGRLNTVHDWTYKITIVYGNLGLSASLVLDKWTRPSWCGPFES